ncbi:MAG: aminopeptidase P family protein [Mucinivorans sp.]
MFSSHTYASRREALRLAVGEGLILIFGNGDSSKNYLSNTYFFRQDSNFLYYFGLSHPDYVGVMDVDSGEDMIFADDVTIDDVIWMGSQPTVCELASEVGVRQSFSSAEVYTVVNRAIASGRKIHFLPPYRSERTLALATLLGIKTSRVADYVSWDLVRAVVAQREIKSEQEVVQIEIAQATGYLMHTTAMKMCGQGVTEREIAGAIEGIALQHGSGTSFMSIVTINGQTLHNHGYDNTLKDGRMLLVDAGAETVMNYCSDSTRTMPVSGKFTQKQREIYQIVLSANLRAKEIARAGVTYKSVHLEALKVMAEGLLALGLIKGSAEQAVLSGAVAMFMPHGLGHQMGLDVHDMEDLGERLVGYDATTERSSEFGLGALRMGKTLHAGHVITVEPGIYFVPDLISKWKAENICSDIINFANIESYLDFGGIRLEDDILITEGGNRLLGEQHIPLSVAQVEDYMAK